jgi:hypothetical protein
MSQAAATYMTFPRRCSTKNLASIYNILKSEIPQERPYHDDSTASRLLSEVKHCRARLVLRWGTTLESRVLFFLHFALLQLLEEMLHYPPQQFFGFGLWIASPWGMACQMSATMTVTTMIDKTN